MNRIHSLSPALVGQIAAGEVVDRPASALKELVENSLDAGAKKIEVELGRGGTDLIRVVDDGGGIHPNDIELALTNHATSKVASADDLARIGTLGFRDEALASLAAIAHVKLQSRPPYLPLGAEVSARGGDISVAGAWAGPPGTRVEVRHLFFSVPARRKFLRSVGTEWGHSQEAFIRVALIRRNMRLFRSFFCWITHHGYEPGNVVWADRVTVSILLLLDQSPRQRDWGIRETARG